MLAGTSRTGTAFSLEAGVHDLRARLRSHRD
jgi:hypothetical protein